jgi:hypothetical protein
MTSLATRFVTCALRTVRRYDTAPDQIDFVILSAINVTLCLRSGGDDRVAEGFNSDIVTSGRDFRGPFDYRGFVARQVMQREAAAFR